jgi:hypothetical protein
VLPVFEKDSIIIFHDETTLIDAKHSTQIEAFLSLCHERQSIQTEKFLPCSLLDEKHSCDVRVHQGEKKKE